MLSVGKFIAFVKIVFVSGFILLTNFGIAQTDTLFWFSAPEVNRYHSGGTAEYPTAGWGNVGTPVYLHLTSVGKAANVIISMPANSANFNGGAPLTVSVAANTTQRIDLSPYIGDNVAGVTSLTSMENRLKWTTSNLGGATPYINRNNKGIKIEADNKITAYYEIGVLYNMDLIALKGNNALGKKFFVPFQTTNNTRSYPYKFRPYSSIDIVATDDNTKVLVTTAIPIWVKGVGSKPAGTHEIWLNEGETSIITAYQNNGGAATDYQTSFAKTSRLAGAYVEVDETVGSGSPITIISHDDLVVSNYSLNPDYVTDQLVPIELIGIDYAVIQGVGYGVAEIEDAFFVVGTKPGTNITIKTYPTLSTTNYTIGTGVTQAFSMNNNGYKVATIKSDFPVYVYHMSGVGRQKAGALIPTISNCTGSNKVAFNRTKAGTYSFYLNILAWNTALGKFRLLRNGVDVTDPNDIAVLNKINTSIDFKALPETGVPYDNWSFNRVDASLLTPNVGYMLVNEENVFHLGVLNGHTDDNAFYGYFSNFNQFKVDAAVGPNTSPAISLCYGSSTQLFVEGGSKWTWSPIDFLDDPHIDKPKVIFPTKSVKYKVVSRGACNLKDSATVNVSVQQVTPSFTADTLYGCGSLTVNFENKSTGNYKFLHWYWKKQGDPDPGTRFKLSNVKIVPLPPDAHLASHTFTNTTTSPITYIVKLYVESPICTKKDSVSIVVYPTVSVAPTVSINNGCNPLSTQLFANATGYTGTASITWDFGDGGSAAILNPIHTFNNIDPAIKVFTSKVKIVDQWNVCKDSNTVNVTVQPFIKASFVINKIEGCSPLSVDIINDSRGGIAQYTWDRDLGDGIDDFTGEGSGTRVYTNPTVTNAVMTIPIRLRVNNSWGCTDQIIRTINVFPQAVVNTFNLDNHGNALGCSPLTIDFNAVTTNATIFHWLIDNNAFDKTDTATYTFENFGSSFVTRNAKFTASNLYGCSSTVTQNITVQPYVDAQFIADKEIGCSPLVVNFLNASSPGSSQFQWFIGGALPITTPNIAPQTFNNTLGTNTPVTIPVRLEARNTAGCTDNITKNIVVNPQATARFTFTDAINLNHCSPFTTTFTSYVKNTDSYHWEFGTYGASNLPNPTFNFVNDGTITVSLRASNIYGCPVDTLQDIIVRPGVKALFSIDKTEGCPPYDFNVLASPQAPPVNYTWNFDGNFDTGQSKKFSNNSNRTGNILTKNITLTVGNGFCSDATTKSIKVYPEVKANFKLESPFASLTGCSPLTVNFHDQSAFYGTNSRNNLNILWNFDDNSSSTDTAIIGHTFVNTDHTNVKDFNLRITATTDKGCTDDTTLIVTAYPTVNAAFNTLITQPCTPVVINVNDVSFVSPTDPPTINWTYTNGTLLPPPGFNISFDNTGTASVNRTIKLHIENKFKCKDSIEQSFAIDPQVVAKLNLTTPSDSLCAPALFSFDNLLSSGLNLTYTWDFKDGVIHTTNSKGSFDHIFENRTSKTKKFDVQLTAENTKGCKSTSSKLIGVYPEVDAKFSMTRISSCTPFKITLKDESLNGNRWNWDFGHTISGLPVDTITKSAGEEFKKIIDNETITDQIKNYKIKLSLRDSITGCNDTISQMLEVYPRVTTNFTVSPISGCSPTTVTFTNSSTGLGSYLWELDNGLSFTQKVPAPLSISNSSTVNEKIVNVKLTSTNILGCKSNLSRAITIAPTVKASFTSSILDGCDTLNADFTNLTPSSVYKYKWIVDGVHQTKDTLVDYNSPFYNPSLTIIKYKVLLESSYKLNSTITCKDTVSKKITVYPRVYPNFSFSDSTGCHPLYTDLNNKTKSFNELTTSYSWDLGNGIYSTLVNLKNQVYKNNSSTNNAIYKIKLIARSIHGCVDSITKTDTVYPKPISSFVMNNESVMCSPFLVTLNNLSVGQGLPDYFFDMDDNKTYTTKDKSLIINHTYHNRTGSSKDYTITLTTTTGKGCTHSTSQTVYAYPEVTAKFSLDKADGCSPLMVNFTGTSDNGYFYLWNFKDGTNSNLMSPNHRFVNITEKDTVFRVYLKSISAYDCVDDTIVPVTVYATPVANFAVMPPLKIFPDAKFNFNNQSSPAADSWTYLWDFGDGFTSNLKDPIDHTYLKWGPNSNDNIYSVNLRVDAPHGCSSSTSNILRLLPALPIPFFDANIYESCSPLEVHFVNASQYGKSYEWDFGDGQTSTVPEPIHTFNEPGYYNVKLKVDGDGGATYYYKTFRVFQNPIANFKVFPYRVMLPNSEVHVYNLTKFATRYEWNLGDGTLSTEKDPVHTYKELGEFDIRLTAYSEEGCVDDTSASPAVWVEGVGKVDFPNAFVPNKGGSNGGKYDDVDYKNEVFHPVHDGVTEYKLMIFNRWGEQMFESTDIKVGWDGYYKGKLCDQGVYIWRAIGKYTNGKSFDKKGNVTLLR